MEILQVTWPRASLVWWSIFWRSFLMTLVAGTAAGLAIGIALTVAGRADLVEPLGRAAGIVVAVPANIWAVRSVLHKEYRRFRVVLVPSTEARLEQSLREKDA